MQEDGTIEEFSLRDKNNLNVLEEILDNLIKVYSVDIKQFRITYQTLPLIIYNKIDALRNVSYERKSDDFIRIAKKAKEVNKKFHNNFK